MWQLQLWHDAIQLELWMGCTIKKTDDSVKYSILLGLWLDVGYQSCIVIHTKDICRCYDWSMGDIPQLSDLHCWNLCEIAPVDSIVGYCLSYASLPLQVSSPDCNPSSASQSGRPQCCLNRDVYICVYVEPLLLISHLFLTLCWVQMIVPCDGKTCCISNTVGISVWEWADVGLDVGLQLVLERNRFQ